MTGQKRKSGRHPANQLTATQVAKLKEPGRYFDGAGLFLRVTETLTKNWIQKLTVNGKQTTLGHGAYPAVSLAEARRKAIEAKALARQGGNPATRTISGAPKFKDAIDSVVALNKHSWRPGYETEFRGCLKHAEALFEKRVDSTLPLMFWPSWSQYGAAKR